MLGTRRDPTQNPIREDRLKWLGEPIGGYRYAIHGNQEYAVDVQPSPDPGDFRREPNEITVIRVMHETFDGTAMEIHRQYRGFRVESGTYLKLAEKEARRAAERAAERPLRTWSVLNGLSAMRRREPLRLLTAPVSNNVTTHLWKAHHGKQASPPYIEVYGNEPPKRSPAGIIADLAGRGVQLTLARGRLLVKSRTPLRFDDRELIEKSEELLTAYLARQPLSCVMCDQPAVDFGFPRAPLCAAHLDGSH